MNILITGGAGFLGTLLTRAILKRGSLRGKKVTSLTVTDLIAPTHPEVVGHPLLSVDTGDLLERVDGLLLSDFDAVFHMASAVSGECEANFDLGLRSNLDTTRRLLDGLRAQQGRTGIAPLFFFSSSVAVFGSDPALPLAAVVQDTTLPTPQSSYGIHKFICEQLVADYTRKGYIDGRVARLMTVSVRPGRPNGAASSFLSGIIREPLAGVPAVCPVDLSTAVALASPATTIAGILAVAEASREDFGGRTALNLPALTVTVGQMLQALEEVAGHDVAKLVMLKPDESIARIVGGWPSRFDCQRTHRFGLKADASYQDIIRQYIEMTR
ncbi:MAG: NAD-dependent epimerase/dehydratase family protein [Sheuella sp.]|nr:NAD-dependent epimerase/dehydratase family protein [Sheuella sp.]